LQGGSRTGPEWADGQTVGLYKPTAITSGTPGAEGFEYLHRDHLGSVDTVTHFDSTLQAIAMLARYGYDVCASSRPIPATRCHAQATSKQSSCRVAC
jgi:hypothetical protein